MRQDIQKLQPAGHLCYFKLTQEKSVTVFILESAMSHETIVEMFRNVAILRNPLN